MGKVTLLAEQTYKLEKVADMIGVRIYFFYKFADFRGFWLKMVPLPCRMLILPLPGPKPTFCRVRNGRCSIGMQVVFATKLLKHDKVSRGFSAICRKSAEDPHPCQHKQENRSQKK